MKIGILTYHKAHNYGAVLQAVATRLYLTSLGHEVYYVDYWPKYHASRYQAFSVDRMRNMSLKMKLVYARDYLKYKKQIKERILNFSLFIDSYITPYCRSIDEKFDVVVYGSDQIWRKQPGLQNQYNPVYFGKDSFSTDKRIAYAGSMGKLPDSAHDRDFLKDLFSHFNAIGVRESSLQAFLGKEGFTSSVVLDPTLLLCQEDWEKSIRIPAAPSFPYLLFYDLHPGDFDYDQVRHFASSMDLKVIRLSGSIKQSTTAFDRTTDGPYEFLSLIKNAAFVLTSSFHGLAFSIIFKKQFLASFSTNADRAVSLLGSLNILDRLLPVKSVIPTELTSLDYKIVSNRLNSLRSSSQKFLIDNIQ